MPVIESRTGDSLIMLFTRSAWLHQVIFVGNQLNTDIKGAVDYGIRCVWLSGEACRSPDDTYHPDEIRPTYTVATLLGAC
jgi:ribonucleotide monophosphatase NagD (HAD superfamily)